MDQNGRYAYLRSFRCTSVSIELVLVKHTEKQLTFPRYMEPIMDILVAKDDKPDTIVDISSW